MATTSHQPDHGGPILIGLRELYAQLVELDRSTSSLAAKVDTAMQLAALASQSPAAQLADIRHDINDHEVRLRRREEQRFVTTRSMWLGIGVLTGVVSILVTIIVAILG